jgi:uncharacterized membrane protein YdbT with pleckstrin-like domain
MSYVQTVLQPGEQVRHTTTIHWVAYFWGVVVLLLAIVTFAFAELAPHCRGFGEIAALVLLATACALLFWEWFTRWTTEIAVTDRRVIHKQGFIRRDTNEMNLDKVESVQVKQSIPGRILDYGDVIIIGTGEGETELKLIARPLVLRNHITGVASTA